MKFGFFFFWTGPFCYCRRKSVTKDQVTLALWCSNYVQAMFLRLVNTESPYLKPLKNTEIILHLSSFDPAVLVFIVHMVSTKNTQPLLRLSIVLIAFDHTIRHT